LYDRQVSALHEYDLKLGRKMLPVSYFLLLKKLFAAPEFLFKKSANEFFTFWMAEGNIWRKVGDFEAYIGEKLAI